MKTPAGLKKTETLEVRLSLEVKEAFMAECRSRGTTASDLVRSYIDAQLTARPTRAPNWRLALAAATAGLAVGAVAAPSLAHPIRSARATCADPGRGHPPVAPAGVRRGP